MWLTSLLFQPILSEWCSLPLADQGSLSKHCWVFIKKCKLKLYLLHRKDLHVKYELFMTLIFQSLISVFDHLWSVMTAAMLCLHSNSHSIISYIIFTSETLAQHMSLHEPCKWSGWWMGTLSLSCSVLVCCGFCDPLWIQSRRFLHHPGVESWFPPFIILIKHR